MLKRMLVIGLAIVSLAAWGFAEVNDELYQPREQTWFVTEEGLARRVAELKTDTQTLRAELQTVQAGLQALRAENQDLRARVQALQEHLQARMEREETQQPK